MSAPQPLHRRECLLVPGLFDAVAARLRTAGGRGAAGQAPAVARLLSEAEASLAAPPPSVLDKLHEPPSGDKRDYFSLSVYYWPDPAKPGGLPYVARDGMTNPQIQEYDRPRLAEMAAHVDTLSFAYAVSGDERYAKKAAEFLRTWFLDERTGIRPNMLFAQYIPGDDVVLPWKQYPARYVPGAGGRKGIYVSFGGVIEDMCLVPLTDCIRLLRPSPHWTSGDDAAMRQWYIAYTQWLQTHQHGLDEAACTNNHGSWYWADIACFLEFTRQADQAARCIREALPQRLAMQIEPDGSQPEELSRTTSKHYVCFTLYSFISIAITAQRCGSDVWSLETEDGRSIRKAMDWFVPYLAGHKPWSWRQIKPFDEAAAVPLLAASARQDPDGGYDLALRQMPPLPVDHRYRLLYDLR